MKELVPGLQWWENRNGFVTLALHYSADPEGPSEAVRKLGTNAEAYEREHNLNFDVSAGKPVFREFSDKHISTKIFHSPDIPIWRGWDFGYHRPAVTYSQPLGDGTWLWLGEILGEDIALSRFIENVVYPYQESRFPNVRFLDCADPAGKQVTDKSDHSSFAILGNYHIFPMARKTEIKEGLTIVRNKLHDTEVGKPGILVHPDHCPITVEAMRGGYHFPERRAGKPEPELPEKDGYYDHIMDGWRYQAVNNFHLWIAKPKPKPIETFVDKILKQKKKQYNPGDE